MPGLHVPQGLVGALEPEQPSWIVGREVVDTRRDTGNAGPQQIVLQENAEDEEELQEVPKDLTKRERLMLQMTQAEDERGAVRVIKCKLCPQEKPFGSWVIFQRHCKSCEKHPSELMYCPSCGDYFGRPDSIKRHLEKKNKAACRGDAEGKQRRVERLLEAFNRRLTDRLMNGLEFKSRFSVVMSKKLTNTSKKVSKTETSSEDDSWADGL